MPWYNSEDQATRDRLNLLWQEMPDQAGGVAVRGRSDGGYSHNPAGSDQSLDSDS